MNKTEVNIDEASVEELSAWLAAQTKMCPCVNDPASTARACGMCWAQNKHDDHCEHCEDGSGKVPLVIEWRKDCPDENCIYGMDRGAPSLYKCRNCNGLGYTPNVTLESALEFVALRRWKLVFITPQQHENVGEPSLWSCIAHPIDGMVYTLENEGFADNSFHATLRALAKGLQAMGCES